MEMVVRSLMLEQRAASISVNSGHLVSLTLRCRNYPTVLYWTSSRAGDCKSLVKIALAKGAS
jgi:hypothetical protein